MMRIYEHVAGAGGASTSDAGPSDLNKFQASKGWFDRFKKRYSLHNVKLSGEHASIDHKVAKMFPAQLMQLSQEKGYLPEQVFNADETGLFWKKMSKQTFISKGTA